jgi:hypothetical protein
VLAWLRVVQGTMERFWQLAKKSQVKDSFKEEAMLENNHNRKSLFFDNAHLETIRARFPKENQLIVER